MQIGKIMTEHPMVIDMDMSLSRIKWIFDNHSFRHLLVAENNELVGVISDRDVLANLSPTVGTQKESTKDALLLNKRAHQIMVPNPKCLSQDDNVFDAIKIFYRDKISCLPIVDEVNKPVGIITTHDVFKVLYEQHKAKAK